MNRVELLGRLTAKALIKEGTTGKGKDAKDWKSAVFTLAVDNGTEKADFINCVAWNGLADVIEKYTDKGHQLAVEGRLTQRSYEDKEGKTVYRTDVYVTGLDLLNNRRDPSEEVDEEPKGKYNRRSR